MAFLPGIYRLEANAHYVGPVRTQPNGGCDVVQWNGPGHWNKPWMRVDNEQHLAEQGWL